MISNSLDWNKLEITLKRRIKLLMHKKEILLMINNIKPKITELSKSEIQARRGKKDHTIELLEKINQDIEMIEEYILIATLLG